MTSRSTISCARITLLALLLTVNGCNSATDVRERSRRASEMLNRGEYNEAVVEIKNWIADAPGDAQAQLLLARASLLFGNVDAAERALTAAVAAKADRGAVDALRAKLLLQRGDFTGLLSALDDNSLALDAAAKDVGRVQALAGVRKYAEAVRVAKASAAASASDEVNAVVADSYLRLGNAQLARAEVEAGLTRAPKSAQLWLAKSGLALADADGPAAEQALLKAAEYGPGQLTVPQLAFLTAMLADLQAAREDAAAVGATRARMLKIAPQSPLVELLGARLDLMKGNLEPAVTSLRKLITNDDTLAPAHRMLGAAYVAQQNIEQARRELAWLDTHANKPGELRGVLASLERVAATQPDNVEHWIDSAAVQLALGESSLARSSLEKALAIEPQSTRVSLATAKLDLHGGHADAALARIKDLVKQHPEDLQVQRALVDASMAARDYSGAATAIDGLIAREPSKALAISLHRARKLGKLGRESEPLEQWLLKNPDDSSVRALYAETLRESGQVAPAIAQYERLVALHANNAMLINNLAWVYQLGGDPRAVATARRALQLAPGNPGVMDTCGWVLVEAGELAEGLKILEQADAMVGIAQPSIRFHYASGLAKAGREAEAASLLEAALAGNPEFPEKTMATKLLASLKRSSTT